MESKYTMKFRSTTDVDDDRVLFSLITHFPLPLLILRIVEYTGWKAFVKASVGVLSARKWAEKIEGNSGVELHPELDIRAQHDGEYLEWVPDGTGKETE